MECGLLQDSSLEQTGMAGDSSTLRIGIGSQDDSGSRLSHCLQDCAACEPVLAGISLDWKVAVRAPS